MMAAPRLPTFGRKSFSIHSWSSTTPAAIWPATCAWNRSGYIVGEWLPHTPICVMSVTGTSSLLASWAIARLWSRRIIEVKRSRGMSGRVVHRDQAVRVGGVADHEHLHVVGGDCVERLALHREDLAVGAAAARRAPCPSCAAASRRAARRWCRRTRRRAGRAGRGRRAAGRHSRSSSIATPSSAPIACGISSRRRSTGCSGPSSCPLAMRKTML